MTQNNPIALITGASSGIGWALALQFAAKGYDLLIIARRTERLEELASIVEKRFNLQCYCLTCDLTEENSQQQIIDFVTSDKLKIDVLINNAGLGENKLFAESVYERTEAMLQVNMRSLVNLTYYFLPKMLSRQKGYVLNVASTAAMQPVPYMAIYAATKAFVLSFSEAINEECRGTGVSITTLCPGPTSSEFSEIARMQKSELFNTRLLGVMSCDYVAKKAIRALFSKKRVVVPGFRQKLLMWISKLTPNALVLRTSKSFTKPK
jgi:short-subunit dehydrogenase